MTPAAAEIDMKMSPILSVWHVSPMPKRPGHCKLQLGAVSDCRSHSETEEQSNHQLKGKPSGTLGARGPAPGDTTSDSSSLMEVDPTARNQAPTTGRLTTSPAETYDLVKEVLSQPATKRAKVAGQRLGSPGPAQTPIGVDWRTNLIAKLNTARFLIRSVVTNTSEIMEQIPDEHLRSLLEDIVERTRVAFKAVDSILKDGSVADLPRPISKKLMSDASTDMELTTAHWDSLAAKTAADADKGAESPP
ncbi:hypothetical protein QTP88_018228 [Uroleucon formosanum]